MPPVEELGQRIRKLLRDYHYDDRVLVRYFATLMQQSVAVDWYSKMLRRPESARDTSGDLEVSERREQIASVAHYLMRRADELYGEGDISDIQLG